MEETSTKSVRDQGLDLLKSGQIDEAIAVFDRMSKDDPDDPEAHSCLGVAYHKKGDRLHTIFHFERALQLQETPRAYYNLGMVYEETHRIDEAVREYRMALELDSGYSRAKDALDRIKTQHGLDMAPPPSQEA